MKTVTDHKQVLEQIITEHFDEARLRVDAVCMERFFSIKAVSRRHWTHRKDIPNDIAAVPRAGWNLIKRSVGKYHKQARQLSGKEQALLDVITVELLQLDELSDQLNQYLEEQVHEAGLTKETLLGLLEESNTEQVESWLKKRIETHSIAQEGARESLVFIATGIVGRTLSDKIVFGSSMGLGSMAATSLYLSQQSWWSGIMVQVFGAPGWVSAVGMLSGAAATLAVIPIVSPFVETATNRFRARRMLINIIDSVEKDMMHDEAELAGIAGRLATFIGLLPELLQVAVKLKG